jgi:hypothetical protein
VSALVDLVEVDQVAIGPPGSRLRGSIALPRKDRDGHRERDRGGPLRGRKSRAVSATSQQSRPDEVALFVSQYSVMSSSTSSWDFSGSLLLYASAATVNGKGIGNVVPN